MPRIIPVSYKVLECIFKRSGFKFKKQEGDHRLYEKAGCLRPVVIPTYKEIQLDIILSNMRSASMSREEYFRHLEKCKKRA